MKQLQHKPFLYVASLVTVASVVGSASVANAATFNFSFSNETGSVPGTVEGMIELPDGDGVLAATSVIVTSAPSEVLPPSGINFVPNAQFNSFEVVNGEIVNSSVNFSFLSTTSDFTLDFFGLDLVILTNEVTGDFVEASIESVNFTDVTSTPEPTSIISLLGVTVLGIASQLKKKA